MRKVTNTFLSKVIISCFIQKHYSNPLALKTKSIIQQKQKNDVLKQDS